MIRASALSTIIGLIYYLFQTTDLLTILDKYGLPLALAVAIFVYFQKIINKMDKKVEGKDVENDGLRQQMLDEQKEQNRILTQLLVEAKASNICQYVNQLK